MPAPAVGTCRLETGKPALKRLDLAQTTACVGVPARQRAVAIAPHHLDRVGREAADIGEAETLDGGVAMAQRLAEELAGVEKDQRRPSIDGGLRLTNQKCEAPLYNIAKR